MKLKASFKIVVDTLMTLGLLFLMGYQFWGDLAHEWAGACMFVLFIAHHALNWRWYKALFKGKYTSMRVVQVTVGFLTLADMLALMISGVMLSRYVFAFLPIEGGASFARLMHMAAAYWGFVLMALHLGLHWNMFIGMTQKAVRIKTVSKFRATSITIIAIGIALYGLYAFINRELPTYMLLKTQFVFLDFSESVFLFYLDYIAIMGLFIGIAHYASKGIKRLSFKKEHDKRRRSN